MNSLGSGSVGGKEAEPRTVVRGDTEPGASGRSNPHPLRAQLRCLSEAGEERLIVYPEAIPQILLSGEHETEEAVVRDDTSLHTYGAGLKSYTAWKEMIFSSYLCRLEEKTQGTGLAAFGRQTNSGRLPGDQSIPAGGRGDLRRPYSACHWISGSDLRTMPIRLTH